MKLVKLTKQVITNGDKNGYDIGETMTGVAENAVVIGKPFHIYRHTVNGVKVHPPDDFITTDILSGEVMEYKFDKGSRVPKVIRIETQNSIWDIEYIV